jgi:hypothetical protein
MKDFFFFSFLISVHVFTLALHAKRAMAHSCLFFAHVTYPPMTNRSLFVFLSVSTRRFCCFGVGGKIM